MTAQLITRDRHPGSSGTRHAPGRPLLWDLPSHKSGVELNYRRRPLPASMQREPRGRNRARGLRAVMSGANDCLLPLPRRWNGLERPIGGLFARAARRASGVRLWSGLDLEVLRVLRSDGVSRVRAAAVMTATIAALMLGYEGVVWAQMGGGPPATAHPEGSSLVHGTRDLLPNVILIDQHGRQVSLASFTGHPVLVDFIDTACAERCVPLMAKLAYVAGKLRHDLGENIFFISISSDPERDSSVRLHKYAREIGGERSGWFFLTGAPTQVGRAMEPFGLELLNEESGWSGIQTRFAYLLNRSGRLRRIYDLRVVRAESLAFDLVRLMPYGDLD
jgi:cytochrome oxidase Cu insertion factor (SCO1/SenC/PrrC family)